MQFNEENSGKKSREDTDQFNFYPEWVHLKDKDPKDFDSAVNLERELQLCRRIG